MDVWLGMYCKLYYSKLVCQVMDMAELYTRQPLYISDRRVDIRIEQVHVHQRNIRPHHPSSISVRIILHSRLQLVVRQQFNYRIRERFWTIKLDKHPPFLIDCFHRMQEWS